MLILGSYTLLIVSLKHILTKHSSIFRPRSSTTRPTGRCQTYHRRCHFRFDCIYLRFLVFRVAWSNFLERLQRSKSTHLPFFPDHTHLTTPQIFPLHINAKCCAITTCTQWLFQIVIASITPRFLASIGWATYVIYAAFCIITYIWVLFAVPETRNVALGKEMDAVFGVTNPVEDLETTVLLRADRGGLRRGSFGAYT